MCMCMSVRTCVYVEYVEVSRVCMCVCKDAKEAGRYNAGLGKMRGRRREGKELGKSRNGYEIDGVRRVGDEG